MKYPALVFNDKNGAKGKATNNFHKTLDKMNVM